MIADFRFEFKLGLKQLYVYGCLWVSLNTFDRCSCDYFDYDCYCDVGLTTGLVWGCDLVGYLLYLLLVDLITFICDMSDQIGSFIGCIVLAFVCRYGWNVLCPMWFRCFVCCLGSTSLFV